VLSLAFDDFLLESVEDDIVRILSKNFIALAFSTTIETNESDLAT